MSDCRFRVLVLARAYPNDVLPTLGLWTEQPTVRLAQSFDVRVVSPVPWCPPLPEAGPLAQYARFRRIPRAERRKGVEVRRPRLLVGPGTSLYALEARTYLAGVWKTVEQMHGERPFDLVHAHFIYPDGVAAHQLSRRLKIPFVVSEHAPWTGWLDRPGIARQALPAACAASAILAVSTSVERTIRAYADDAPRIEIVPVGVNPELFRLRPDLPRRPDQILFVGFINYVKGVDVLLRALRLLADRGLPGRALLIGGSFYRNTRLQEQELRALAERLQLGDRVAFLGRRPPEDVARLMAESAVVVLPSRAESFGAVLVEALACGTPVVATRCGGPEDIVSRDVGMLVSVDDVEGLAESLSVMLARRSEYDPSELRAYAVERFSWPTVTKDIERAYRRVLGSPSNGAGGQ